MSGPTKGMVAGKPIQSGELTKEFEEGHARTFGEGSRERGRFRWNPETRQMERLDAGWTGAERRAPVLTEELVHGGTRAPDGTDIGSRKKRREWMKETGLADAGDFKNHLREEKARRESINKQGYDERKVREVQDTVGRSAYELSKKRRR